MTFWALILKGRDDRKLVRLSGIYLQKQLPGGLQGVSLCGPMSYTFSTWFVGGKNLSILFF